MRTIAGMILTCLLAGCIGINSSIDIADGETVDDDRSTVNGSINVGRDATVTGDLETVNGSADIGQGSRVGNVETVNGRIDVADNVSAAGLESVNGRITLGANVTVDNDIDAVNGRISIGSGSRVGGEVSSVNGHITLTGADVGSLTNHTGGMELAGGARVRGDLTVERGRNSDDGQPQDVTIGADCVVEGNLVFERKVNLRIHKTATVGEIRGAEPEYFE